MSLEVVTTAPGRYKGVVPGRALRSLSHHISKPRRWKLVCKLFSARRAVSQRQPWTTGGIYAWATTMIDMRLIRKPEGTSVQCAAG